MKYLGNQPSIEIVQVTDEVDLSTVAMPETTLYVDGTLGSDTNDGLTSGAGAFATIQAAVDAIAPIFTGDITISIAAGTYAGFTVQGKAPAGSYNIFIIGEYTEVSSASATLVAGTTYTHGTVTSTGLFSSCAVGDILYFETDDSYRVIDTFTNDVAKTVGTLASSTTQTVSVRRSAVQITSSITTSYNQVAVEYHWLSMGSNLSMSGYAGSDFTARYITGSVTFTISGAGKIYYCYSTGRSDSYWGSSVTKSGTLMLSKFCGTYASGITISPIYGGKVNLRGCILEGIGAASNYGMAAQNGGFSDSYSAASYGGASVIRNYTYGCYANYLSVMSNTLNTAYSYFINCNNSTLATNGSYVK